MSDTELAKTGVPAEGLDPELDKTGVPSQPPTLAPATALPTITDGAQRLANAAGSGSLGGYAGAGNDLTERPRIQGGGTRTFGKPEQTFLRPVGPNDLVGDDRDLAKLRLSEYDPSLIGNERAMDENLRLLSAVWSPEMRQLMLESDVGVSAAMAMSEKEYVAAKILAMGLGNETTPERILGASIRSAIVQYEDRAARLWTPGNVYADQNIQEQAFEASKTRIDDIADLVDLSAFEARAGTISGDASEGILSSGEGLRDFLDSPEVRAVTQRGGIWKVKDNTLVFAFSETEGKDDRSVFAGVRLDEGTTVTSTAEALAALVEAQAGFRHTLLTSPVEGPRVLPGIVNKFIGDTVRFVERNGKRVADNTIGRPEADYTDEEDAGRAAAARRIASGDAAIEVAVSLRQEPELAGMPIGQIMAAAQEITNDPTFNADYTSKTVDQIVASAKVDNDEKGTWVDWTTETIIPPVVDLLVGYDKIVQGIGITVLTTGIGGLNVIDGDAMTTFQSAFDNARESEYVSELFGIDPASAAGQSINLGASILFDPITWVTPGAVMSWKWLEESVTNPAMTRRLLSSPQIRSGVRQVVKGQDARMVLAFFSEGMSDDALEAMLRISGTKYSKRSARQAAGEEVYQILAKELPANGGMWTPAMPQNMVFAKNVMGIGTVINDMSSMVGKFGITSPKVKRMFDRWAGIWARASKDRAMSLSDDFVQEIMKLSTWRHGDDMAKVSVRVKEALKVRRSMEAGSTEEIAALTVRREAAREELRVARRGVAADENLRTLPQWREFRDQLQGRIVRADGRRVTLHRGKGGSPLFDDLRVTGDGVDEAIRRADSIVEAYGRDYDAANLIVADRRLEGRRLSAELDTMQNPGNRQALADYVDQFYDDWAEEIGVPKILGADGEEIFDWGAVTSRRVRQVEETDTSWFVGYVGPVDETVEGLTVTQQQQVLKNKALAEELKAFGLNPARTIRVTPASPIEMLGYQHGSAIYRNTMGRAPQAAQDAVTSSLNMVQNVFAANVLLNPTVAVKSAGDESIRLFASAGTRTIPGQVGALPIVERAGVGRANLSARAVAYGRDGASPSASNVGTNWVVVKASKNPGAVERFVNGTMVREEAVREYAKARLAGNTADFTKWWEETGQHIYKGTGQNGPMTAEQAYQMLDTTFTHFTTRGATPLKKDIVDEVLGAAAEGRRAELATAQWRQFPDVPGQQRATTLKKPVDYGFEQLFGRPSNARGSLIFDHYYEWKRGILMKAANRGSVVDGVRMAPDKVILDQTGTGEAQRLFNAGLFDTVEEASTAVVAGRQSPVIQQMLSDGWRLESDIDAAAAAFGKASADSMMYTMGAVSVGGKRMARILPWARAQTDYIGWWTKQLLQPTQVKVPFSRNPARVFTPSTAARGTLPELNRVNVRLVDRIGKLAVLDPDTDPSKRPDAGTPAWMVNQFTFLPTRLDESFILEQTPSMGPIPSWLVNFLDEDNPVRQAVSALSPSHAIFNDYTNDNLFDSVRNAVDAVIPASGRTIRRLLSDQIFARGMAVFGDSSNGIYNWLLSNSEPTMTRENLTILMIDFLDQDIFDPAFVAGGGALDDKLRAMRDEATTTAYTRQANESIKKYVGAPSYLGAEAQYAKSYLPLLDLLPGLVESGQISEASAANLVAAAQPVSTALDSSEAASSFKELKTRKLFANAAADILRYSMTDSQRDKYILENPSVAVNFVRWIEPDEDLVPDKYRQYVDNGRIVAPASIRDQMMRDGFKDGWIVGRELDEVLDDVVKVVYRAAASELTSLWDDYMPFSIQSTAQDKMGQTGTIPEGWAARLTGFADRTGLEIPEEWVAPDGSITVNAGEYKQWIVDGKTAFATGFEIPSKLKNILAPRVAADAGLLKDDRQMEKIFRDLGYNSPVDAVAGPDWDEAWAAKIEKEEWPKDTLLPSAEGFEPGSPEGLRALMRERHAAEVALNSAYTPGLYAGSFQRTWGPLDYKAPEPPKVGELDVSFTAPSTAWSVVDGDTIELSADDGTAVPFRLVGINAPERDQDGYREWNLALQKLLSDADTVTVGMFRRETFGETQTFYDGSGNLRTRIFGWLYVDGVPIFDPNVFTESNERGAPQGVGGEPVPKFEEWRLRETGEEVG